MELHPRPGSNPISIPCVFFPWRISQQSYTFLLPIFCRFSSWSLLFHKSSSFGTLSTLMQIRFSFVPFFLRSIFAQINSCLEKDLTFVLIKRNFLRHFKMLSYSAELAFTRTLFRNLTAVFEFATQCCHIYQFMFQNDLLLKSPQIV